MNLLRAFLKMKEKRTTKPQREEVAPRFLLIFFVKFCVLYAFVVHVFIFKQALIGEANYYPEQMVLPG